MKKTVAIIGGSQRNTFEKMASKSGMKLIFHNGKVKSCVKKEFRPIIKKADVVVVLGGACQHVSMWKVKELAKDMAKPIGFIEGFGATGAINMAAELMM